MSMEEYKAEFTRDGRTTRTRWYSDPKSAQFRLMGHPGCGWFELLGCAPGDSVDADGNCRSAPRNGGVVNLVSRTIED
jgi:hypothetical protein